MTNVVVRNVDEAAHETLAYVLSRIESRVNRGMPVGVASMDTLANLDPMLYTQWMDSMNDLHNRIISIDEVSELVLAHYSNPTTWANLEKDAKSKGGKK